jgi:hypothetical protein
LEKAFLEFWGNFLLSAAKGQRQIDEFARWMSQGMSGFHDLTAMFQQCYGLRNERPDGDRGWKTARTSFETAFRAYLDTLGFVPKSDYLALQMQIEELRQKIDQQESDLRRLRLQLGESRMAQGDVVRGFQELIQVQGEQFREVTESFSRFIAGQPPEK